MPKDAATLLAASDKYRFRLIKENISCVCFEIQSKQQKQNTAAALPSSDLIPDATQSEPNTVLVLQL